MAHPNWLTRLTDVKTKLNINRSDYDSLLTSLITQVSAYVEKQTLRIIKPHRYVEYYDGGRQIITLKQAPVLQVNGVWEDASREFASSSQLTTEYYQCSTNGRLVRIDTKFVSGFNTVKIDYWAGFSEHYVSDGSFTVISSSTEHSASISTGKYNIIDLASAVQTAMNSLGIGTFTVSFDGDLQRIEITGDVDFAIKVGSEVADAMGFITQQSEAKSCYSDDAIIGIPPDLKDAVEGIIGFKFLLYSQAKIPIRSESRGDQTLQFDFQDIPLHYRIILDSYAMRRIG